MDICMTFNTCGRIPDPPRPCAGGGGPEGLELLAKARENNLVQFGENVRQGVNFICNCCGCCCEAMIAARRFAVMHPIHTTNFLPRVDEQTCNGCGRCVPVPGGGHDPGFGQRSQASQTKDGPGGRKPLPGLRGVPAGVHPEPAASPSSTGPTGADPLNGAHRAVIMAVERGKLQHLLFDNRVLWHHRALAAVLGVILRLPPVKRAMATDQVKSRYLEALALRFS
jgi:hypothetical protein